MTVKELMAILNSVPSDATVVYSNDCYYSSSESIVYDDATNTVYLSDRWVDEVDDDVDESNYDPYSGCDVYEADEQY